MKTKHSAIWENQSLLEEVITSSKTTTEILTKLGINHNSGNYQTLKSRALKYGIELPKFDYRNSNTVAARLKIRYL